MMEIFENSDLFDFEEKPALDLSEQQIKVQKKHALVIGRRNEFIVGSMITELERRSFKVDSAEATVTSISEADSEIHIYLLVLETVAEARTLLVYLKDQIYDKHLRVFIICHRGDDNEIYKTLPKEDINTIYYRPVNTKEIGADIEKVYEETKNEVKRKSILLIDDDPAFLRRTQTILRNEYKTYIVNSGTSAILLMAKHSVDLILLDYDMPIIDGPHVYQMIKAEPELSNIPIMFLTGKRDVESVKTAVLLKPAGYITKETNAEDLMNTIRSYFLSSYH